MTTNLHRPHSSFHRLSRPWKAYPIFPKLSKTMWTLWYHTHSPVVAASVVPARQRAGSWPWPAPAPVALATRPACGWAPAPCRGCSSARQRSAAAPAGSPTHTAQNQEHLQELVCWSRWEVRACAWMCICVHVCVYIHACMGYEERELFSSISSFVYVVFG